NTPRKKSPIEKQLEKCLKRVKPNQKTKSQKVVLQQKKTEFIPDVVAPLTQFEFVVTEYLKENEFSQVVELLEFQLERQLPVSSDLLANVLIYCVLNDKWEDAEKVISMKQDVEAVKSAFRKLMRKKRLKFAL